MHLSWVLRIKRELGRGCAFTTYREWANVPDAAHLSAAPLLAGQAGFMLYAQDPWLFPQALLAFKSQLGIALMYACVPSPQSSAAGLGLALAATGLPPLPTSHVTARWRACLYASAQQCALAYIVVRQRTSAQSPTANAKSSARSRTRMPRWCRAYAIRPRLVSAREARHCRRLHHRVVAVPARRGERAVGVRVGPRRGERMVCVDRQPRHAAARRVGGGGLRRDAVTLGGTAWLVVGLGAITAITASYPVGSMHGF